jgi:hypothetical protein
MFMGLVPAVLLLAGCGSPSQPQGSGIYGIVVINRGLVVTGQPSPSPSPLPDGFGLSVDVPSPTPFDVAVSKDGRVVARTKTANRLFRVVLPPDRYVLRYAWHVEGYPPVTERYGPFPVTVRAGRYTRTILELEAH